MRLPIRRSLLLGIVFALAFLAAAIATFPARFAYALVSPPPGSLVCRGIRGTVWSGHAQRCRLLGRISGRLRWSVARGLSGIGDLVRLTPRVRLSWRSRSTRLALSVVLANPLRVRGLRGRLRLATLRAFVPAIALFGTPHGEIVFHRLDLDLGPGHLGPIVGSARLIHARFGGPPALPLGTLVFVAMREGDGTSSRIDIRSLRPRTLSIDAHLLLHERGSYRLTAALKALPGAPAALAGFINTLPGNPHSGVHDFVSSGVLPLTTAGVP